MLQIDVPKVPLYHCSSSQQMPPCTPVGGGCEDVPGEGMGDEHLPNKQADEESLGPMKQSDDAEEAAVRRQKGKYTYVPGDPKRARKRTAATPAHVASFADCWRRFITDEMITRVVDSTRNRVKDLKVLIRP
eukprot:CAMPEP_0183792006 /NCGR_PEP_ID=MMETSP0803_2-20130417/2268_1 /TAXON_ID=195967 /ORGANISM="Crustomastix stigmata, Strain CCMP3273" /LENGTH=131 /DNA_ID=CAMNT_0026036347 /DNA_START=235 /DNA_END=631 /DNA_ORIENTATION=-